jgi:FkbM family methyltransferase
MTTLAKDTLKALLKMFGLRVWTVRGSNFHSIVGIEIISSAEERRRVERERNRWTIVERLSSDADSRITRGTIVRTTVHDQEVFFFIENEKDEVQRDHMCGLFYEEEELQIIARYFNGGIFLDVGANVGNHALYAAKFLNATKVIAIEPNPAAYLILRCNIALNNVQSVVMHYGVGLSNMPSRASQKTQVDNLSGTRLIPDQHGGSLELVRGDDLLHGQPVDFIKVDTEGMEMRVLAGLTQTLANHHPPIFVEVDDINIAAFHAFLRRHGYRIAREHQRYRGNTNFLAVSA